ncbi:uncharacterized protein LOC129763528 [Toxorhynchites rutilus septentrionalis]|uniref:uncharacterized protein LOC129763528 n=1 Tax=Toxorhynchites rutilus septentrionalis TaxID=329112 RepID=UPI00247AC4AE|nr:uncharacterized protein LOC129763528 [Toxorhynchites rutilus septentrionalis]
MAIKFSHLNSFHQINNTTDSVGKILKMENNSTTLALELCAELLVEVFPDVSPVLKKCTVKIGPNVWVKSGPYADVFRTTLPAFMITIVLGLFLTRRTIVSNVNCNLFRRAFGVKMISVLRLATMDYFSNTNPSVGCDGMHASEKPEVVGDTDGSEYISTEELTEKSQCLEDSSNCEVNRPGIATTDLLNIGENLTDIGEHITTKPKIVLPCSQMVSTKQLLAMKLALMGDE